MRNLQPADWIFLTRTITDHGTEFDRIVKGYTGPLYAEICPRSFSVLVRPGMRLNQIRFRAGHAVLRRSGLKELHAHTPLVSGDALIQDGLGFSVDLSASRNGLVGYRAKPHTGVIDLGKIVPTSRLIFGKKSVRKIKKSSWTRGVLHS